ncbi:hypothetical protein SNE40_022598 [Patella caerulea]|uniref:Uncharacterized protein n=1 Tax=Patella caerulea TaxID=87958 RepID=A0AAN8G5S0_PATCE
MPLYSLFGIIAALLSGAGCIVHVIGLSVVYWIVSDPYVSGWGTGLWQHCNFYQCSHHSTYYVCSLEYWKASQAMVMIGFFVGLAGFIFTIISVQQKNRLLHLVSAIACILAAVSILLAVIVFGAKTTLRPNTQWGWGFILCAISPLIFIPAGVLNFWLYRGTTSV